MAERRRRRAFSPLSPFFPDRKVSNVEMTKFCEITAVRHGQTFDNIRGVLQGQKNSELDPNGVAQAGAAALRLAGESFDAVYSSDLGRTLQTASILMSRHHPPLEIIPVPDLREWNFGELQGRAYAELQEKYPEIMNALKRNSDNVSVPGGESSAEFQKRISDFLDAISERHPGEKLLIVTHGGAMQCVFRHVVGKPSGNNAMPLADNASVSRFRRNLDTGAWQLITWNDCAHLQDLELKPTLTY